MRAHRPDRGAAPALFALGLALLGFLLGAWVAHRDVFPYRNALRNAFIGASALADAYLPRFGESPTDVWVAGPEAAARRGVLARDAALAAPGLTLVTVGQYAHLVDLEGTVRHSWHVGYAATRPPGGARAPDPARVFWRPARVFPDGDLLTIVDEYESPSGGLALIRLDRDSRLRWAYHGKVHHDFDVARDGRVLVLGKRVIPEPPKGLLKLRGPLLDELVVVLSPAGEPLEEISIIDAFARTPLHVVPNRFWEEGESRIGDYLHSNNLDLVTAEVAARFPFAREGQVLLSLRNIDTIALMDLKRPAITWARHDGWSRQHDPDFLDNGRILIFDNLGDLNRGGRSRVVEYDPVTRGIAWEYPGALAERDMHTRYRGDQQRLPNGNTLITEFYQGRVLEVTREGRTAWEYVSPFTHPADPARWGRIFYAERYAPGTLRFELNGGRLPEVDGGGA